MIFFKALLEAARVMRREFEYVSTLLAEIANLEGRTAEAITILQDAVTIISANHTTLISMLTVDI